MSIARTRVTPSTYEERQSILGTVARLFRPQRSQSAHINQDDGDDVEVDVPGDSIVAHTHERNGGNKTRISRIFGHDECCGGTCVLGMLGERSMEAVSQDWRAWVVGIFSATVCRLSGLCKVDPWCWIYPGRLG